MANSVWLEFADGTYLFHLTSKMIAALEKKVGSHFGVIHGRTLVGLLPPPAEDMDWIVDYREAQWSHPELIEIIRHGLLGGGKAYVNDEEKKLEAFHVAHLITNFVEGMTGEALWKLTGSIVFAAMHGYEQPGEVPGAKAPETQSRKASLESEGTPDT